MATTCQLYTDNKGALNTWAKGHYRPQSFEFDLYMAVMQIFNEGRAEWENNQVITDKNRGFFKNAQIAIKDTPQGGLIPYPLDYASFSSIRFYSKTEDGAGVVCDGIEMVDSGKCRDLTEEEKADMNKEEELFERNITKVDNQRWGSLATHVKKKPSLKFPYSTQLEGGFKVVPRDLGYVILNYLRIPTRPVFNYKLDARMNVICLPGCSELEYGPEVLPDIMSRIKIAYSSFVGDQQKYAEGTKEKSAMGA